jgi:hypothetical protein
MVISRPQPLAPPCSISALSCVHVAPPWEQQLTAVLGGAMSPGTSLVVGSPCAPPSPSSCPPPTVVLLVLEVEPESSVVVVGFCVVRRYRVIVAIAPITLVLGADIRRCRSEFCAPTIYPGAVAHRAGGKCSALPCRVVISHCGWA